ncbi:hypothetical protein AURDEDRAFT_121796 [Auricularia subglabra TFB-10046 SS5]|nr:hypothetical protein AURDEDRAFT_121796 [Auricularia subglabra TFB-10046 SS5]
MASACLAFTATLSATAVGLLGPVVFNMLNMHKPGASPQPSPSISDWLRRPTPAPAAQVVTLFPDDPPVDLEHLSKAVEPVGLSNILMLVAVVYLMLPVSKRLWQCFLCPVISVFELLRALAKPLWDILRFAVPVIDHRVKLVDIMLAIDAVLILLLIDHPILGIPAPFMGTQLGASMDHLQQYNTTSSSWCGFFIKMLFSAYVLTQINDLGNLKLHAYTFAHFLSAALIVKIFSGVDWDSLFVLMDEHLNGPAAAWSNLPRRPT